MSKELNNLIAYFIGFGRERETVAVDFVIEKIKEYMTKEPTVIVAKPGKWVKITACPACKSENIKWHLSSTKECKECGNVFRAEELV